METESQKVLSASAPRLESLEDENGRRIDVRALTRRETMRCMRTWGPAANVESWLAMAIVCASVTAIDSRPIPMPQTAEQVEGIAEQLAAEGFRAVENWFVARQQEEQNLAAERAAAKNSLRTPS